MYPSLQQSVQDILYVDWNISNGTVVPKTDDIVLKNGGRLVNATYVYADLAGSSKLAKTVYKEVTAAVIRAYISTASRVFREYQGAIRSFDGDRVMAVFIGHDKETRAVRAALAINWAVVEILRPAMAERWTDFENYYTIKHGIGIDTGEALIVRGGVRDNNDLISIGEAPNQAAKLSEIRDDYSLTITKAVYESMSNEVTSFEGTAFWTRTDVRNEEGGLTTLFRSNARWGV
ncbi:class 3 adenylate cyclase [Arthrobacter stackebrandtii]|uniref:Class 3 adenylate cyclase n=1 Tax=Arthrobacter stackebrandtii TaxID=272161 RepID=A0ABS4YTA8_9MICC|nr:adenylate/guanylate cyclase domain-containing protein [Arthrobacter stackebrandtii]MBP2412026.1 class 3 adenylate cyclase [Arthrobacter stackebrandtii]PYG98863.1 adenylate/guanylate cyclase domain-containing protein [Arthrobacter stackebrandtii]